MRINLGFRLVGCSAFVAVCAAVHAQIVVSYNPNLYASQYTENFEEFAPEGATALAPTTVGLLYGVPILDQNAAITLTYPGTTAQGGDGTSLAIYNPPTDVAVGAQHWGLETAPPAETYDNSLQGLGIQTDSDYLNSDFDENLANITITLQPGVSDEYFAGYFQSAYWTPPYPDDGDVIFSFYNGTNLVGTESIVTNPSAVTGLGTNALVGVAFTFTGGDSFTSVQISGNYVVMDSLRVNQTAQSVPEPAPFAVMGLGLGAMALLRRRRR